MRVAIDVVHSTAWAVEFARKSLDGPAPEFAEMGYLGHLADILEEWLAAEVRVLDEPWTAEALAGVDLLLAPLVCRGGDRAWSDADACQLEQFVRAGGGLLLFGDGDASPVQPGVALPGLEVRLGAAFAAQVREHPNGYLRSLDLLADAVPGHPATAGVRQVHVHRARPLTCAGDSAVESLARHGDQVLVAATELGAGRVAVVGNGEVFALPFLGRADNAELLLNLTAWLATGEARPQIRQWAADLVRERTFPTRTTDPREDLKLVCGPHSIDARPYQSLLERVGGAPLPHPYRDEDTFVAEAELRYHELPRVIRQAVGAFRRSSNDYGVLLIRGLPVGHRLPPTPATGYGAEGKADWLGELWLAAVASALGSPFSYRQEKSGRLFQELYPTPGNATNLSSESSTVLLDFHTETAFHPFLPDYVLLLCLRPDHEQVARTISAGVRMILPELSLQDRAVLFEPQFRTGIDYSFGSPNGTKGNGPVLPVLYGDPYDPYLMLDLDLMVGLTPDAERALANLKVAVNAVKRWARLDTGDLLVVDNRRAVHGRSEFTARYDGFDRWLQRMCVVRDMQPSAADRRAGARVLETEFAV